MGPRPIEHEQRMHAAVLAVVRQAAPGSIAESLGITRQRIEFPDRRNVHQDHREVRVRPSSCSQRPFQGRLEFHSPQDEPDRAVRLLPGRQARRRALPFLPPVSLIRGSGGVAVGQMGGSGLVQGIPPNRLTRQVKTDRRLVARKRCHKRDGIICIPA